MNRFGIISWNIAGIKKVGELREYLNGFDIIAFQETWLEKKDEKKEIEKLDKGFTWHAKAAVKEKKKGRAKGGVLVGIKKEIKSKEILEWEYGITIKGVKIEKERDVNIIVVYNNGRIKEVLGKLGKVLEKLRENGEQTLIIGDTNARIGDWQVNEEGEAERGRRSMDKTVNYEGKKLVEFCEEIGAKIINGAINGDWEGAYTYNGESSESVLDLVIAVESGRAEIVKEMRVKPRIESDHFPIEVYIERLEVREDSREKAERGKKEEKLSWKNERKLEYTEKMEENSASISEAGPEAQKRWENLVKCIWEAGRECKMTKIMGGKERVWGIEGDREVKDQKRRTWNALKRWAKSRKVSDKENLKTERKKLKDIRKEKKEKIMKEKWEKIEKSRTVSDFWEGIRGFRKRKKRVMGNVKKEEWLGHFKKLLGEKKQEGGMEKAMEERRNEEGEEDELNEEITVEETKRALGRMKNGKAAGEDGITVEFLKYLPEIWLKEFAEILNGIFKGEELIKGWEVARICPIFKDGDENDTKNYRGVALLNVGYKVLANILASRLGNWMEKNKKIGESQAGFRKARGTRDHIFVLNKVIGGKLNNKKGKVYVGFIDFRTAFDSVNREVMIGKIEKLGVRGRFLGIIRKIYRNTENEVITEEGVTERFGTDKGVRQGCPLSGTLFIAYLEDLEDRWVKRNEGGTVVGRKKIFCLKFADDVAAIADTPEGLQSMLRDLEKFSEENGMAVNGKKTKVMVFRNGGRRRIEKWWYRGEEIEVVNEYKYLGYWFTTKNTYSLHIRRMANKVKKLINAIWGIWKRARIGRLSDRLYVMDAVVRAGCLYGVEIWGWETWEEIEKIQGRYVKMAMGVNSNTPDYIWRTESGRNKLDIRTMGRAGRYLAEVAEMSEERWPKICLKEETRCAGNGCPSKWGKGVKKAFERVGDGIGLEGFRGKEEWERKVERGMKVKRDQEWQNSWGKIDRSKYCEAYKTWKSTLGREEYWESRKWAGEVKEQWARLRCGNLGRQNSKGFKETRCRVCGDEEENVSHIWKCRKAREEINKEWIEEVERKGLGKEGEVFKQKYTELLKGELNEGASKYSRKFEQLAREKELGGVRDIDAETQSEKP